MQIVTLLGLASFLIGSESLYSLVLPVLLLQKEFLSHSQAVRVILSNQIGCLCGQLLLALVGKFGRRVLPFGLLAQFFLYTAIAMVDDYEDLLILRFLAGANFQVVSHHLYRLGAENSFAEMKVYCNLILSLFQVIGRFYLLLLSSFFLKDFQVSSYKSISLCLGIPSLFGFFTVFFTLPDTLSDLVLSKCAIQSAEALFNEIGRTNSAKFQPLSNEERVTLNALYEASL